MNPTPPRIPARHESTPPTIAACVVWYDEPIVALERCIRSIRDTDAADFIVTSDGRWEGFDDGGPVCSPAETRHRVLELVLDLFPAPDGIAMETFQVPFESQVQKRARAYRTASLIADWLLVIDGDEYVETCDPRELRATLEHTDHLVGHVGLRTLHGPSAPQGISTPPRLFRSRHGITVENSHNGVRTLDGRWLAGDPVAVAIEPGVRVGQHLQMFHTQGAERPRERELRDRRYRRRRYELGIEGWPPRARSGHA